MAVTKIRKISSWTLIAITIISAVVFGLFFLGGTDPSWTGEQWAPAYTGLLLYWCYILVAIAALFLVVFAILQFAGNFKANPKKALTSLGILVLFALLLLVTYFMGDITPMTGINADSEKFNIPFWLRVTDMWLYASYIMLGLCVLAMIWGSVKKVFNK